MLLEELFRIQDYSCVRDYATRSFLIDPHNSRDHFWLIMAFINSKSKKLAGDALDKAKGILSPDDFEDVLLHLRKQAPGFVREKSKEHNSQLSRLIQ